MVFDLFFLLRDSESDLLHMKHDANEVLGLFFLLNQVLMCTYLFCTTDGSVVFLKNAAVVDHFTSLADSLFSAITLSRRVKVTWHPEALWPT